MKHGSPEPTPSDDLSTRLETLESRLREERRRSRRLERLLIGGLLVATFAGVAAGTAARTAVDVVQTRRLEILDENDRVVLLATAARHGGRVDIWDAAQQIGRAHV
mgnify:FL=1